MNESPLPNLPSEVGASERVSADYDLYVRRISEDTIEFYSPSNPTIRGTFNQDDDGRWRDHLGRELWSAGEVGDWEWVPK